MQMESIFRVKLLPTPFKGANVGFNAFMLGNLVLL